MIERANVAAILEAWASTEPSVEALVLIGSRVRGENDGVWRADAHSDWDFHIITSKPQRFVRGEWTRELAPLQVRAYSARAARIGGIPKVNIVFDVEETDLVILPARSLRILKWLFLMGLYSGRPAIYRKLQELAVVIRPGWKFLKGARKWEPFYRRTVAAVLDPRLTNEEIRQLADGFVCDYVSINRKIARGEFLSAQRLLHRDLIEINFRLFHELRLRMGKRSFPEVRRIEFIAEPEAVAELSFEDRLDQKNLHAASEKAAAGCRSLVKKLVGDLWEWPPEIQNRKY